jgi:hypothetical protein
MIIEWVAQVSILGPGFSGLATICEEKPRSQNRDLSHTLKVWRLVFRQSEEHWRDLRFFPLVLTHPYGLCRPIRCLEEQRCQHQRHCSQQLDQHVQ